MDDISGNRVSPIYPESSVRSEIPAPPERTLSFFLSSTFDFQLSTFNLRIAPSPTLLALCPKSVKQVSSHQSLPHSFLKLPECVPTIPKMELSSQHSPPSLKFFLFKFLRTLLRFFALTQKATCFFSSDSAL